ENRSKEVKCVYVSSAAPYKHQWHVVNAIKILRDEGIPVSLTLVGGGSGYSQKRLDKEIQLSDPTGIFVTQYSFIHIDNIPRVLSESDLFIFASSCENMPVTLIEGMASGLPIACSDRGPMPEVLGDGGVYFNPENPQSIADAVKMIIDNKDLRAKGIEVSKEISNQYLWKINSEKTFQFLTETIQKNEQN
ncbi:MAG: glycosyltransferase, partial [SAR86 cluster bacterium]|nr:glycosyltransferase [SAR86 cluster bacterium]